MYRLLIIALTFANALAETPVSRCGDSPFPTYVQIEGCDIQPCPIIKGTTGRFHLEFVADFDAKNLTTNVVAKIFGMSVAYPVPDDQKYTCQHLLHGSYCPIYKGEDVSYVFELFIGTFYPEISLSVEVSVTDEKDRVLTCFSAAISVKKGE
ncbi:unnamed protein product [Hermetia illucens]|uniref:MD-2-related lipid-recognition domain-containing protein n=1 Tax=Hermetia illucens TaxID=343691 RepID=A0A7R8UPX0_HERIL|nr:NPC intracellular cholesterol transporter 2-like [Hermetia illucens]CAD7084475.1 unnamed protein product [Hermetia illucens]